MDQVASQLLPQAAHLTGVVLIKLDGVPERYFRCSKKQLDLPIWFIML